MSRGYAAEFENIIFSQSSGDQEYWTILTPADDRNWYPTVLVIDMFTELGDAQEEHANIRIVAGDTWGTGGGTATPAPLDPNDTAAAGSFFEYANPIVGTPGASPRYLMSDGFNVRLGYRRELPRTLVSGGIYVPWRIRQTNALNDDVNVNSTLSYVEVG